MSFQRQHNPLLARERNRRIRGIVLSAGAALVILATGGFAVSAQTAGQSQGRQVGPSAETQIASASLRGNETVQGNETRRQVRVIPLFNTPANPTGFAAK